MKSEALLGIIKVSKLHSRRQNDCYHQKKLFEHAYGKYAIGAYNINNLEQIEGLFRGNLQSQAPFIIQISKGARSYTNKTFLEGLIRAADEIYPEAILLSILTMATGKLAMTVLIRVFTAR